MVKLIYLLLLAAAALFYPLYEDKLSYLTLVSLIILPFIMLLQLIISAVFLKCSTAAESINVFKGTEGEVCIRIANRSVFPLSNTKVRVKAVYYPTGETKYYTAGVPLPALRTETVTINVGGEHCGKVDISVEYIRIYDLLRLFSVKLYKKKLSAAAYVIPKVSERYRELAASIVKNSSDISCEDSSSDKMYVSGSPGDVCGFREFSPGDRASLIHHKLSARFDCDMVKILSQENSSRYLLTADLFDCSDHNVRDERLERLMSCAYYMREEGVTVYVAAPVESDFTAEAFSDDSDYFNIARVMSESCCTAADRADGCILCDVTSKGDMGI